VENLSAEQLLGDLSRLARVAEGAIRIEYAPEEITSYEPPASEDSELNFRYFPGPVKGRWRRSRWADLAQPDAQQPARASAVVMAPESLPALLCQPGVRACSDPASLQTWLCERGWSGDCAAALAVPLHALLSRAQVAGQPLSGLLGEAQPEVPVCLALDGAGAELLDGALRERWAGSGFLEDRIDWLLPVTGRYHAVFLCWQVWSPRTPALLGLADRARLVGRVLDRYLRQRLPGYQPAQQLGAVHFLFPGALSETDPEAGYRYYPAPGADLPGQFPEDSP